MQIICTKVRDGAKRLVQIKEGEPQGRHVVIVDDLVQSGGTLIECHAVLSRNGAKHGEFAGRAGGWVSTGPAYGATRYACMCLQFWNLPH
jgi:hypoxanthine phosphoribosyltransferase